MAEHNPFVLSYSHLRDFSRDKDALLILKKVASLVKPIMRARGWTVKELAEFYPDQSNLLGLNVNHGQKILLRLRYPTDRTLFLPVEQITDTMLHELSHIVHGPHDAKFHALWNQLRDEHEALVRKGYTGEGFLSEGHRLGGRQIPMSEARRFARAAAEKRKVVSAGSGQKLGGSAPRPGEDIRIVIVNAIERRNKTLQGCGNTRHNDVEIRAISDMATRNGFRTQAEEDAANEAAIAQALWELVQEEEKAKYGSSYIPPSAEHPEGSQGSTVIEQTGASAAGATTGINPAARQPPPIPVHTRPEVKASSPLARPPAATSSSASGWTCGICTLHNPVASLSCDACGTERPPAVTAALVDQTNKRSRNAVDLTSSPARPSKNSKSRNSEPISASGPSVPALWHCSFCGKEMERQWWTCSLCGKLKDSS